ncbi:hypothetical protein FRC11_008768 [Ceratobasidium sp. 423]|nr:hypothetical protein FRC11_008768 [Ceratobasidium sp. 423]
MSFGMHDPTNPANHSDSEDSFVTHSAYQPEDDTHILSAPELEALLRRIECEVKKLAFADTTATGARRQTSSAGACGRGSGTFKHTPTPYPMRRGPLPPPRLGQSQSCRHGAPQPPTPPWDAPKNKPHALSLIISKTATIRIDEMTPTFGKHH